LAESLKRKSCKCVTELGSEISPDLGGSRPPDESCPTCLPAWKSSSAAF
jgi:hypothetical protein